MWNWFKSTSSEFKAFLLVATLVACSLLYNWYHPEVPQSKDFTPTKELPVVKTVPKEEVPVKKLKVYKKTELEKKVKLPDSVKSDDKQQVTASADLGKTKAGYEVLAVVDTTREEVRLISREKELPLVGFENQKSIGVGYNLKSSGEQEVIVRGGYTFFRVGEIYTSVNAEVNNKAEGKVGLFVDYRW